MKTLLLPLMIGLAGPASANRISDELLAAFQARLEARASVDELCDSLEEHENETLKDLTSELNKAWPTIRDRYLSALEAAAKTGGSGDRAARQKRIRDLRQSFMEVYQMNEDAMKPLLGSKSMPAVSELRKLLMPTAEELIAAAPPELVPLREAATKLAKFRDAALDAELSTIPTDSIVTLSEGEKKIAEKAADLPKDGLRILENNRKIAEDHDIPAGEAEGIEECNLWRLQVGLGALVLDPKLCEASRDHSKDMAEKGFFAHDSPVPGKATPWDRARNFGTTASGENIYNGGNQPSGANRGWFFSPGHHKNMFNPGQRRIGLGHHQGRWTQMFGT